MAISTSFSYALNEKQFTVDYDISYRIQENGIAQVEQNVTLTNLKNDVVPTSYSFSAKDMKIIDVSAESNDNKVSVELNTGDEDPGFAVPISDQLIGKGKQNKIKVSYKTEGLVVKNGDVWNIYVPKIQIPDSTEIYNVKVYVPKKFGPKMYFSPTPIVEKEEESDFIYYLTKNTFKGAGISAAFGPAQVINFRIKYQLENKSILPISYGVPLPSDIKGYQQVSYSDINPKPKNINIDKDGNTIASFYLGSKQKLEVELVGSAKVITPQIDPDRGGNFSAIPKDILSRYTSEKKYWNTNTKKIIEVAKSLKNGNLNVVKNAQLAYKYVVDNLQYDFEALNKDFVERQGSEVALTQKGSWTCMEYTDLFIALARTMGIPAREVDGYAFNTGDDSKPLPLNIKNGDLLHAWAEFYDPNYGWIQIDPTWGSTSGIDYFTKLDTNRLALVVKGLDSELPQPAGSYRYQEGQKLIEVDYNQKESTETFTPKLSIKRTFNLNVFQLIKGNARYVVTNESGVYLYTSDGKVIPPFGKAVTYFSKKSNEAIFTTINGTSIKASY